jgi:uncharacterized protein YjbI with pentapeptide repeats
MTVLDTEALPSHHALFPTQTLERMMAASAAQGALSCPNTNALSMPHFQKAAQLVEQLANALLNEQAEAFNEVRQQLTALLKKHGEPVTQWNPLVLELANPDILSGRTLSGMNFGMTRLCASDGLLRLDHCNLQGSQFLCADLSRVALPHADLSGADCRYADLREVDLSHAVLIEADLSHAKLSDANLNEADLYCAKLNGALAKQVCLQDANLRKVDLRNADLYQANLRFARLQNTDLREVNLFMADLTGARLRHADLRKAHLSFCSLKEARLPNARLEGANLTSANLTLANLQKCRLSGGSFSRARFTQAKMNFATLQNTNLSEAIELETANLQGAMYDQNTHFPRGFKPKKHALTSTNLLGVKGMLYRMINRLSLPQPGHTAS